MPTFKVSIIIPLYNREKFITRAVESCIYLPQTGEIIIVDDGSTDKSLNIALELARKYPNVKVIQHPDKKNHGRSAARNLGIKTAKFEYISFLDSDDWYLPNRFESEETIFTIKKMIILPILRQNSCIRVIIMPFCAPFCEVRLAIGLSAQSI